MENVKLIKVIKLLSETERKKLAEFVETVYFNKDQKIAFFIHTLLSTAPSYSISKENCFQLIFPDTEFDSLRFRRISSKALKLVERFIIELELEEDPLAKTKFLSNFYQRKDEPSFFEEQMKKLEKALKPYAWNVQAMERFEIEFRRWNFIGLSDEKKVIYNRQELWRKQTDRLNTAFELMTLRLLLYISSSISLERVNKVVELKEFPLFKSIVDFVEKNKSSYVKKWEDQPELLHVYFSNKIIIDNGDTAAFKVLKKLRDGKVKELPQAVLRDICLVLNIYYTYVSFHQEEKKDVEERFENWQFMLKHKLVFRNDTFNIYFFIGIIETACSLEKVSWCRNFIKKYVSMLPNDHGETIALFGRGILTFTAGEYKKTSDYLSRISVNQNFFYHLKIKRLQIKAHYELGDKELVFDLINSYRAWISRNKRSEFVSGRGRKFANTVQQLLNFHPGHSKHIAKLKSLEGTIDGSFADKEWLLMKLAEKLQN